MKITTLFLSAFIACYLAAGDLHGDEENTTDQSFVETVQKQQTKRKAALNEVLDDPTQSNPALEEILGQQETNNKTIVTDQEVALPDIALKAILMVNGKPPAAMIEINKNMYIVETNTNITLKENEDNNTTLRVLSISDAGVALSMPDGGVLTIK